MTEWGVFGVVIALVGFAATFLAPALKLNSSITKLTVTVERLVKERQEKPKPKSAKKAEDPNLLYVEEVMQNKLQTRVKVDKKQIVIQYSGTQDLNRILELIHCLEETES